MNRAFVASSDLEEAEIALLAAAIKLWKEFLLAAQRSKTDK